MIGVIVMRFFRLNSLKTKYSLIFILVMVPLFIAFVAFEVNQQANALRQSLTARGVIMAQTGAVTTGKIFESAIKDGKLAAGQVFDHNYKLTPGTNPPKYHTQYDAFTDEKLREIEDAYL